MTSGFVEILLTSNEVMCIEKIYVAQPFRRLGLDFKIMKELFRFLFKRKSIKKIVINMRKKYHSLMKRLVKFDFKIENSFVKKSGETLEYLTTYSIKKKAFNLKFN